MAHVVNLGNVDMMNCITKTAAVENTTAIWEYDPTLEGNRVLGGLLDVIAAIRTLVIKVRADIYLHILVFMLPQIQASGQRIEYFQSTQIRCGIPEALKIPLHSNIRWGTAFKMLDQAQRLHQVSVLCLLYFVNSSTHSPLPSSSHLPMRCMGLSRPYAAITASRNTSLGPHSSY